MSFIVHFQRIIWVRILLFQSMKIICAGFPKTGSKSCSAALRILGFKVADWIETAEYLGDTWIVGIPRKICVSIIGQENLAIPERQIIWMKRLKSRMLLLNMMN